MVSTIATTRSTITTRPERGLRSAKNAHDHRALRTSCTKNAAIAPDRPGAARGRDSMRHAATAIIRYRNVQAAGKAQFGGVKPGFARPAYQVGIFGLVARVPRAPASATGPSAR